MNTLAEWSHPIPGHKYINFLFEGFLQANCDWLQSTLYLRLTSSAVKRSTGRVRWMCRAELMVKDNNAAIVDTIIERKRKSMDYQATNLLCAPACCLCSWGHCWCISSMHGLCGLASVRLFES